jgi:hypothetical protein
MSVEISTSVRGFSAILIIEAVRVYKEKIAASAAISTWACPLLESVCRPFAFGAHGSRSTADTSINCTPVRLNIFKPNRNRDGPLKHELKVLFYLRRGASSADQSNEWGNEYRCPAFF